MEDPEENLDPNEVTVPLIPPDPAALSSSFSTSSINESFLPLITEARHSGQSHNIEIGSGSIDYGKYNDNNQTWKNCWNWCGLASPDEKTRGRARIGCGIFLVFNIVFIILLFLVSPFSYIRYFFQYQICRLFYPQLFNQW
jgi:hypothetical protein